MKPGERPGFYVSMATFMVSAFWHGFYPYYYFMFFQAALFSELTKDLFKARALFSFIPHPLGSILANVLSLFYMGYLGVCFNNLTFERGGIVA